MLWWLVACVPDEGVGAAAGALEIRAVVDPELPTVVHVTWRTDTPTIGEVRYVQGGRSRTTPAPEWTTDHHVALVGLPPDAAVQVEVVALDAEGVELGAGATDVSTGVWGPELPALTSTGSVESWRGGFVVLSTAGAASWALVLDDEARVVWAWPVALAEGEDLMRARLSADGSAMLLLISGHHTEAGGNSRVERVNLDGSGVTTVPWPYLDHDLVDLGGGTLAGIQKVATDRGWGDAIVEMDNRGKRRLVYATWTDPGLPEATNEQLEDEATHANALDYDLAENAYYLNVYLQKMLVRVDRATGSATAHLYGEGGAYVPSEATEPLGSAHQFQVLGAGHFLHFENGPDVRASSRVRELRFDEARHSYEQVWSYEADPPLYVYAKGDVERFADGGTEILWATSGRIEDVNAAGEPVWRADLDLGTVFTYLQHVDRLGP